jgi:hypothetical protein
MDIILPLGPGSRHDNLELRYALRSFEQYLPHDRVIIVGELPAWLQNITHIPFAHNSGFGVRAKNIYNKILAGFEITEQCIFCNDDHFILQNIPVMPYHHRGAMVPNNIDSYGRLQKNTIALYPGCLDFDTHCPIIYERSKMPALNMPGNGIGIKSAYCAHNKITGEFYPDCKIMSPMNEVQIWSRINGRMYFSCGDMGINEDFKKVLQSLYPQKSKYEN